MRIISRSQWGAQPWRTGYHSTPLSSRTHFLVHYEGGYPTTATGNEIPRRIERGHLNNGWSGIGYNFVVSQAGEIFEGRGWDLVGAHCPGKNRTGIGVQVHVGGDQEPSEAAKAAVVWLYGEANRKTGRTLITGVHGDYYATLCAGDEVSPWVHAGMKLRDGGAQSVPFEPIPVTRPKPGKLAEDGLLGPATYTALQKVIGVNADGIWGPATRRGLQRFLRVKVDGIIGTESVRALQRWVGVKVDGVWGINTTRGLQRALNADKARPKARLRDKIKPKGETSSKLLKPGSTGSRVRSLQRGLNDSFPAYSRLSVDGIYGPATERAVREFQRRSGLGADGVVGPRTRRELRKYGIAA